MHNRFWSGKKNSTNQVFLAYQKIIEALIELHDRGTTALKQANIHLLLTDCFSEDLIYFKDYFLKHFDSENRFSKKCQPELTQLESSLKKASVNRIKWVSSLGIVKQEILFFISKNLTLLITKMLFFGSIFYDLASLFFASLFRISKMKLDFLFTIKKEF